jgi:hypothetical protein
MPTATPTRNLGKTSFLKELFNDNPQANASSVNEVWKAAGFEGTISQSLVKRVRSELGLTGNMRKGPAGGAGAQSGTTAAPATKRRGRRKRATGRGRGGNQGKTAFVAEHLRQDPGATDEAINEAWASAGNDGGISGSLIYKIRAKERLTKRRRAKGRGIGKKGRVGWTAVPVAGKPRPLDGRTSRGRSLAEVEADIDRLIFKLIALGGMEQIEDELRKVRRLLYRSYSV